ncbi:concanavalin A-like lectin/glucanase domain-containing protein [Chaetomium tenue]|uniref:Concanavalin A-like lectin/glucanase domain-containing protein n=1 Tax=Chaetomium tenue TaxID=1854479 RepID=A0ACB7PQS8_9PEZI|nr:concanavalin A-like lectin/glucanase domain-containing protein [Chaetomium globosum]
MVQFSLLTAASLLVPGMLAAPAAEPANNLQARFDGNGFNSWSEGGSNIRCVNGQGGSFTANWNSKGGFVCGKGWNGQGARTIKFTGTYNATGPGYLAIYGWTRNPLIEYYIVESHADLAPNEPWTSKGEFTIDGEGTYEIFTSTRVNKPSIEGTRTFQQYWSVRKEKRVGGTVTTTKHFDAWKAKGMGLGNYDSVIVAVEGYTADGGPGSSGSASINIE